MKISKETLDYLQERATRPDGDPFRVVLAKDAKIILEALGVVMRPDKCLTWLEGFVGAVQHSSWHALSFQDAKDLLAYIKQLEENQK